MPDPIVPERWISIPDYEGLYEVSDLGRVRSLDRAIVESTTGQVQHRRGKLLALSPDVRDGYVLVTLCRSGQRWCVHVHALVLRAFVSDRPAGKECRHGNDDKTDNRLANLSWGTRSQNILDTVRAETHHMARRTHCPLGHALVAPNLRRINARSCLACSRAQGNHRYALRQGWVSDLKALADGHYARIMRPAA